MKYTFKIRNIEVDLSEPTLESLNKFLEDSMIGIFICDEMKEDIRKDFLTLLETRTYDIKKKEVNRKW